jgi:hypothetical protein
MKSFDVWDTLLTRRFMRDEWHYRTREGKPDPKGFEFANLLPIQENVAKYVKGDYIVSDYGDGSQEYTDFVVKALREVCHMDIDADHVIVTIGGKYEGSVWSRLPEPSSIHIGDNVKADIESPRAVGIPGELVQFGPFTEAEKFVSDRIPQLAMVMRETRLRTFGPYRGIEIMQSNYNFPALFCASIILNRRFPTQKFLMSARDCYMWWHLMKQLFNRGYYWYTSCNLRMNADENYHKYIQSFGDNILLVDLCGSGNSFSHLPMYPSYLMFTPAASQWNVPAMWRGPDVWRLEQANRAPHLKCGGIDYHPGGEPEFVPRFLDRGIDCANEPHIKAQCDTFFLAMSLLWYYDQPSMLQASDDTCLEIIQYMLPHYINFADAVEPLRQIDILEDK